MNESSVSPRFEARVDEWEAALRRAADPLDEPLPDNPVFRCLLLWRGREKGRGGRLDRLASLCAEASVPWREAFEGTTAYFVGLNQPVSGRGGRFLAAWRARWRPRLVAFIALGWVIPVGVAFVVQRSAPRSEGAIGAIVAAGLFAALVWLRESIRHHYARPRLWRRSAAQALRLFDSFERGTAARGKRLARYAGYAIGAVFLFYPALWLFMMCGFLGFAPWMLALSDHGGAEFFAPLESDAWLRGVAIWSFMAGGYIFCAAIRAIEWLASPSLAKIERRFAERYWRLTRHPG